MRDFARLCLGYIHSWQDLMEYAKRRALYHPRQGWVESESSIKIMLHDAWIETEVIKVGFEHLTDHKVTNGLFAETWNKRQKIEG